MGTDSKCVTIYLLILSYLQRLSYLRRLSYLIFRSATPGSLHTRHTPMTQHILGYRVFALFIFKHGTHTLVPITDS